METIVEKAPYRHCEKVEKKARSADLTNAKMDVEVIEE